MRLSFNKLWHILVDRKMNKAMLARAANVSISTLTKMSKDESVNSEILVKICTALNCGWGDIAELISDCEQTQD
jgi:DNA-binding Xre family transcriptional regulator